MLHDVNELITVPRAQVSVLSCTSELYDHKATNILREETFCKVLSIVQLLRPENSRYRFCVICVYFVATLQWKA